MTIKKLNFIIISFKFRNSYVYFFQNQVLLLFFLCCISYKLRIINSLIFRFQTYIYFYLLFLFTNCSLEFLGRKFCSFVICSFDEMIWKSQLSLQGLHESLANSIFGKADFKSLVDMVFPSFSKEPFLQSILWLFF